MIIIDLLKLVGDGKSEKVLNQLLVYFKNENDADKLLLVTSLLRRFKQLKTDWALGKEDANSMETKQNILNASIIELILSIEERDIEKATRHSHEISKQLDLLIEQRVSKKSERLFQDFTDWLDGTRIKTADRIIEKCKAEMPDKKIDWQFFSFELMDTFIMLSGALSENKIGKLDNPEHFFRTHFKEKKLCLFAMDALIQEIPGVTRITVKSKNIAIQFIKYIKERMGLL